MSKTKIILFILIVAYTIYFSWVAIARHHAGFSGRFDLGNMGQAVWNTSEGRIFQMTNPDTSEISSRLAFHADFLLVLIAPIYKLFPHTETLLIIQALIVALGAIPVFLIAKYTFSVGEGLTTFPMGRVTNPPLRTTTKKAVLRLDLIGLFFAILYLLSPILQRANIFDFHSEVLGVTFLLFAFYFLLTEKTKPFLLFFFLSLISKETVSLTLAMICFWGIVKNKKRTLCLLLLVGCVAYFLFMVRVAIPTANGVTGRHFALRHFGEEDESFGEIITGYLKNPLALFITIAGENARAYYEKIFAFGGIIALFSPLTLLISLPTILINVLARDVQFQSLDYQYASTIIPGLMISMIYGTRIILSNTNQYYQILTNTNKNRGNILYKICGLIIFITSGFLIIYNLRQYSPIPGIGEKPYLDFLTYKNPAIEKIRDWETRIPSDKSVSVTNNAGAHFAKRQNLYVFPNKIGVVDYVIIAARSWSEWVTDEKRDKIIAQLKLNSNYKLLDETKSFWLFQKQINAERFSSTCSCSFPRRACPREGVGRGSRVADAANLDPRSLIIKIIR